MASHEIDCMQFAARSLGVRLDDEHAKALYTYCARNAINLSTGVRRLIMLSRDDNAEKTLDEIARLLGLEPHSTRVEDLVAAVQKLGEELDPNIQPTTEPADTAAPRILSRSDDDEDLTEHERRLVARAPADKREALATRLKQKNAKRAADARAVAEGRAANAARNRKAGHKGYEK
jgi:hypothetical protein